MACALNRSSIDDIVLDYYRTNLGNPGISLSDKFEDLGRDEDSVAADLKPLKARIRKRDKQCRVSKKMTPSKFKKNKSLDEAAAQLFDNLEEAS